MRTIVRIIGRLSLLLLIVLLLLLEKGMPFRATAVSEAEDSRRITFRIAAVERHGSAETLLSEALIEGPPGTDFTVKLNSEQFRMKASFLTDLTSANALSVRATLDTRRLYGYSERKLPLYEEDEQQPSFTLGFDEQIVLLPFGRKGDDDQLRITIIPSWSDQSSRLLSGKPRPLSISILKETGGSISIEASKKPHRFEASAALLEDGREIARSSSESLFGAPSELPMVPGTQTPNAASVSPLTVRLRVEDYIRNRPDDEAAISFDIDRVNQLDLKRESLASNWAGVCALGRPVLYDLTGLYSGDPARKYELQLTVKLAANESAP